MLIVVVVVVLILVALLSSFCVFVCATQMRKWKWKNCRAKALSSRENKLHNAMGI